MPDRLTPANGELNSGTGVGRTQIVMLFLGIFCLYQVFVAEKFLSNNLSTMTSNTTGSSSSAVQYPFHLSPLVIPQGKAQNLPSVRVTDDDIDRKIYGGKGDKKHLGGFTEIDMHGLSPAVWKYAVTNLTVQSVIDVGCGKGTSTSWFVTHGLRTECVEGSHDAIEQNMVPDKSILTEHDFSRGPWWPEETFDMVWSVEFLEHISLHNHFNYISTFRKAAIIMVTSSNWGGWHHVEVHKDDWWITKFEAYGFRFNPKLTAEVRQVAQDESDAKIVFPPNGKKLNAQHVWTTMKVFVNPIVAALPQHAHLFGEVGCFQAMKKPKRECGKPATPRQAESAAIETPLDPSFYPLKLDSDQDQAWYDIVKANIPQSE